MGDMKSIILGIALTAIASGLFRLLCPDSSFKKQIGFMITSFFILSCFSFVTDSSFNISDIFSVSEQSGAYIDFSQETDRFTRQEIEYRIAKALGEKLEEDGINFKEIQVYIDISPYSGISIKQVRLAFVENDPENAAQADMVTKTKEIVRKEVGNEAQIVIEFCGY